MNAHLISVGCNIYSDESLNNLSGAENDAIAIYEALVQGEYSMYTEKASFLLRSVTGEEIKAALEASLFESDPTDIFTMFFAGHGGVVNGTYYLCTRETCLDRIGLTGLPLSEIFRIIASSNAKHVNIIIDACYTAGLVNDLLSLIKPELMGAKGSFGISILAAAASDETASEVAGQGVLTGSLLGILRGQERTGILFEYLDLTSIGRVISTKFIQDGVKQTPSSWGMNLYGPSIFAKNPFRSDNGPISTHDFSFIAPASKLGKILLDHKDKLWKTYDQFDRSECLEELLSELRSALAKTESTHEILMLVRGVGLRFVSKYDADYDFRQLEILNCMVSLLMRWIHVDDVNRSIEDIEHIFKAIGAELIEKTIELIDQDNYYLLYRNGAGFDVLANYYYLPIRLSKILGYVSQLMLIDKSLRDHGVTLIELIWRKYSQHVLSISEVQAPFLHSFFVILHSLGQSELAEQYLLAYLNSYIQFRGQVTLLDLEPAKAANFVVQKYSQPNVNEDYISNPDGLGSSLLLNAQIYGLNRNIDSNLHHLDRHNFHIFIPNKKEEYGDKFIENGLNIVLKCGFDFWSCEEFERIVVEQFNKNSEIKLDEMTNKDRFLYVACAFCQPDRLPIMI